MQIVQAAAPAARIGARHIAERHHRQVRRHAFGDQLCRDLRCGATAHVEDQRGFRVGEAAPVEAFGQAALA